ncbi:MAG: hypothetical protein QOI38_2334, partial [Sphingomonadales bacterium]|nr:hypothetical protein [Sphingomonadales bacterium]
MQSMVEGYLPRPSLWPTPTH